MMNERIKSFALSAGFAYEPTKDQLWVSGPTEMMISPGLVKFAELIVKECADLLEKEAESGHDEGTASYDVLLTMSKWMKHYFGLNL